MASVLRSEKISRIWWCGHQRGGVSSSRFGAPREAFLSSRGSLVAPICAISKMMGSDFFKFGPYKINPSEVFHSTDLSYAMVNLRPLVPGHVLVCPRREVKRFTDLKEEEISDLWVTARDVGSRVEQYHKASSLTFAIQDGAHAGQTVPHVHIHILPRKTGDFEKNDEIYDAIDKKESEMKEKLDLDKERNDRTSEEMAREANEYRSLFSKLIS
ncbi:FRAGILE HISTIDINE TRIAD [Wolffia australiana]